MYAKILVPLDMSKQAEMILPHVEKMAKVMDSEVIIFVMVEPGAQKPSTHEAKYYIDAFERDLKEAKDYLAGVQGSVSQMGINCRGYVEYGSATKAIVQAVESENVDLVAMARHARSGIASAFSGGVAVGVMQAIRIPMLVIRAPRNT